jgi:hypothetical protein
VLVPQSEKKLVGLARLRSDIPPDHNKQLLERAKRLFVQHSGGVEARDMSNEEIAEYEAMLPAAPIPQVLRADAPADNEHEEAPPAAERDALFSDEQIIIKPNEVRTNEGVFKLEDRTCYGVRDANGTSFKLLLIAAFLVPFTHLSNLGQTIGSPTWVASLAGMFGLGSLVALMLGLAAPRTVYLKGHGGGQSDRTISIYSSRNGQDVRAVLDALARASTERKSEREKSKAERIARELAEREAAGVQRALEEAEQEARFETLLQKAAAKDPMPFQVWASTQSDGHLLTSTAEYLAVRLDDAYGAPGIVDRFFERGLKHVVIDDIKATASRVPQRFDVVSILRGRTSARYEIATAPESNWTESLRREIVDQLRRQRELANKLGLTRLERQYRDLIRTF